MGYSFSECLANVTATKKLLSDVGFIINNQKSSFIPSQVINFLGFTINSLNMTISLPDLKREKIKSLCESVLTSSEIKIRFLAEFIGVIVSSLPAVENGALFYRFLESNKIDALKQAKGNFEALTSLTEESRAEVIWWLKNIDSVINS